MKRIAHGALAALLLTAACGGDEQAPKTEPGTAAAATPAGGVRVKWDRRAPMLSPQELEKGRLDMSWTEVVQLDPAPAGQDPPNPEKWENINPQSMRNTPMHLPVYGDVAGPSVLRVQVLLDRALFSPGIMDGRWGKNTAQALYWFQRREGLRATARADRATFERLQQVAGNPSELVVRHTLTADDVKGPFTKIPEDVYEHAKLDCSCYETLGEKLSERFHVTPDLLKQLNGGADLDAMKAGGTLWVPAVRGNDAAGRGQVAAIEVSGRGSYVHALDAQGRILYHFPSTLGATYSPSPEGSFKVNGVARDPTWHYQPDILAGVDDSDAEAMIPAGPNVAVGTVWIDLSEPHFGIHGTSAPESIGYTTSNGCVRLTNWDVEFLSRHVKTGVPVRFRDIKGREGQQAGAASGSGGATAADANRAVTGSLNAGADSAKGSAPRRPTDRPRTPQAPRERRTPRADTTSAATSDTMKAPR